MSEPSLNTAYNELQAEVGFFLGFGRGPNYGDIAWTAQQQQAIDSCVKSGLRAFYYPPIAEGQAEPYAWSFMRPTATMTLYVNTNTILLPDDFGGFEGRITILGVQNQTWWPLDLVNEGIVRAKYSEFPEMISRPLLASLQPLKGTGAQQAQRFQLFIFPTADQTYTIQFQYYVNPDYLSGALPFAYGGPQHAETILESCLAIAESRLDDMDGVHAERFAARLPASIAMDKRSKEQHLGYNSDDSDNRDLVRRRMWNHYDDTILINGQQY
jgi:hypothetical protein